METISIELESPALLIVAVVTFVSLITVCLMFYILKSKKVMESKKREVLFVSLVTGSTALMLLGGFGANHFNEQRNTDKIETAVAELGEDLSGEQLQQLRDDEILELSKDKVIVLSDEGVTIDLILYDAQKNLENQESLELEQEKALGDDS